MTWVKWHQRCLCEEDFLHESIIALAHRRDTLLWRQKNSGRRSAVPRKAFAEVTAHLPHSRRAATRAVR